MSTHILSMTKIVHDLSNHGPKNLFEIGAVVSELQPLFPAEMLLIINLDSEYFSMKNSVFIINLFSKSMI